MSRLNFEDEAFQIKGLRYGQDDRVVGGLKAPLQNPNPAPCILSCIRQHFRKHTFAKMMRTGTSNKDAARPQQPHGAVIDFFVPSERAFEAFLVFSERRRVKDDGVVPGALPMPVAEKVKSVRFDRLDVRQTIAVCIGPDQFNGGPGNVYRFDALADITDLKGKAAGVGKGIQCFAVRIVPGGPVIFPLIEIAAGFLPCSKRQSEFFSVLVDGKQFRQWNADEFLLEFESLQFTHPAIISKENRRRLISFAENIGDQGLHAIRCLDEALDDKPVLVSIYNQAR